MTLSQHSAAPTAAGFTYQFERALYWLARSPAGSRIGVETEDDIAVRGGDDPAIQEQDKHSVREQWEPFGDRSKDLWNTLAIWVDALDKREIGDSTRFFMVTNRRLSDCIVCRIDAAKSDAEVEVCISDLISAAQAPSEQIEAAAQRVLREDSRRSLRTVIAQCELNDASSSSAGPELRKLTIASLQLPTWLSTSADSIADELLGWLHTTTLASWQRREAAWIERDHFINQLHAIMSLRRRQITRERAAHLIEVTNETVGAERRNRFVRQLQWITDDDDLVDGAIREFIRCNIEKTRLSVEGNVTDEDWKTFEFTLLDRWAKIRSRLTRMQAGAPEAHIGFQIFTETTEDYREKLAGADTEQVYLTSGTYHRLADMRRVGWHPRFTELMLELFGEP
jgi:hypothetical protein